MASGDLRGNTPKDLTGVGLRVGVIKARWNEEIVSRLDQGVSTALSALNVRQVREVEVPGCFEIPFACRALALSGEIDALICLGAVIRGETTHYELVANECGAGVMHVQLETGIPVGMGVLTVENLTQALARSEVPEGHNVGAEAAQVAVEMARLAQKWVRSEG